MEYTYYVDKDGVVNRLHVEQDGDPWNPREDDGNIGTMYCMHSRYSLGDETEISDALGMKYAMLRDAGIAPKKVIEMAKKGSDRLHIRLSYDRHDKMWNLMSRENPEKIYAGEYYLEYLEEEIIASLGVSEIVRLSDGKLVALPLYLMDHSGLSMRTVSFRDPWDSGQVGWIWSTVDKAEKITGLHGLDKVRIEEKLKAEVKLYSQYLEGDVYGFIVERYEKGEWIDTESVWGFYPSTSDPLSELSDEVFGSGNWSPSEPELPEVMLTRAEQIRNMTDGELRDLIAGGTLEHIKALLTGEELLKWLQTECPAL